MIPDNISCLSYLLYLVSQGGFLSKHSLIPASWIVYHYTKSTHLLAKNL